MAEKFNHKKRNALSLWWRIVSHTFRWWYLLIIAIISMVGFALANLAMVYLVGPALTTLFDPQHATVASQLGNLSTATDIKAKFELFVAPIIYKNSPIATLERFCIILLVVVLSKNFFQYIQNIFSMQLLQNVTNDFRKRTFSKLLKLPLSFFHRMKSGDLISRIISDVQMMQESVSVTIADMVRDPLQVAVYYAFLLAIDYKLTLEMTLVVPIVIYVMSIIGRYLRRYGARMQRKMGELSSVLQEGIVGIRVVKAFGTEEFEAGKFKKIANGYLKSLMKMYRVNRLAGPFNETVGVLLAVMILWFGGRKVLSGTGPTPAEFMQYIVTLLLMMAPVKSFAEKVNRVQQGLAAAERVFWLLDQKQEMVSKQDAVRIKNLEGEIHFDNVSFKYEKADKFAVKNLELTIPRGKMVALVGHSGAGKSTIADLLARFYDPVEGKITIDGNDLRDVDLKSWLNKLGIVTQEVILFNDTVASNISYGDEEPDMERIISSARAANAFDFIEKMPQKFDTFIGDRGVKLSGGERQRIAIARAIYRNPEVLIFDEATSALDSRAERLVQNAIDNLVEGRTSLVIAHRLSTIMRAHKIAVVEQGEKICEGNHSELLENCKIYRELYEMQFER